MILFRSAVLRRYLGQFFLIIDFSLFQKIIDGNDVVK